MTRDDLLWDALLLLGDTVQDIRRMGDAVDRGVSSRASCRAFADRVSAARAEIGRRAEALRRGTCATCAHIDEAETHAGYTYCAAPDDIVRFPFRHKSMPLGERCTGWTAKSDE